MTSPDNPLPLRVLFVCGANAIQSQMAEGWLRHLGAERYVVRSAGVAPRHLHPLATRVMEESSVFIASQRGKGLEAVRHERFDLLITLSDEAHDAIPSYLTASARRHHAVDDPTFFEDPDGIGDLDAFRAARDEIRALVEALLSEG